MRIAVLGLGKMGAPMARNLAEIGHQVRGYNRTPERARDLAAAGMRVAGTVAEAVADAQVALTIVSGDAAEEALTFGADGLLAKLPAGAIHLSMSTIGVETSRKLAAAHAERGQGYVAAPVFGRPGAAATRHLWIVAGGPEAQMARCLPIFDALARGVTRVGVLPELAHAVKLGGSLFTTAMVEALSEVLAFGEKAGMPPAEYLRLLNTAIFKSPLLDAFGGLMVRHAYTPADLTLGQAARDARAALQAAEAMDATLPMAVLLNHRLQVADGWGLGNEDLAALFRATRMSIGLEGGPRPHSPEVPPPEPPLVMSVSPAPPSLPVPPIPAAPPIPPAPPVMEPPRLAASPVVIPALAEPPPPPLPAPIPPPRFEPPMPGVSTDGNPEGPLELFLVMSDAGPMSLPLRGTTHFQLIKDQVWAWHGGLKHATVWRSLGDVEAAFRHVYFLRIQKDTILNPAAVLDFKPLFGGRSKVLVGEGLELEVSRATTPRLKEVLGL